MKKARVSPILSLVAHVSLFPFPMMTGAGLADWSNYFPWLSYRWFSNTRFTVADRARFRARYYLAPTTGL